MALWTTCGELPIVVHTPTAVLHSRYASVTRRARGRFPQDVLPTTTTTIFFLKKLGYTWGNVLPGKRCAHDFTIRADLSPLRNKLPRGGHRHWLYALPE
jgi:hypothetical protein